MHTCKCMLNTWPFAISIHVYFRVFTIVTIILVHVVCSCMNCKVSFSHEPSSTILGHTLVGFDGVMDYFMLCKLTLKTKPLSTGLTRNFLFLVVIQMELEC